MVRRRGWISIGLALSLVALATLAGACNGARQGQGVTPTALGCEASAGTSIAGQPAPYTCVDTGFRPDPHGFSFANWGGVAAAMPSRPRHSSPCSGRRTCASTRTRASARHGRLRSSGPRR